ncbi:hypothetical protein B0T18DRAFT_142744 [Schizothecium vesticola]|uniref:Secreted protein n=1 Tax=Schizothecium vesticola TaxID=314040 RepID=A0AA40EV24_9PEZI|nr:hypothetical protein B0T18DRAFT_142744 [Schizothecium vesticola]
MHVPTRLLCSAVCLWPMTKSIFSSTTLLTTIGMPSHIADSRSRWVGKPVTFESIELVVQEMETERGWTTSEMPVPSPVPFQQNGNLKFGSRLPCQLYFLDCLWRA